MKKMTVNLIICMVFLAAIAVSGCTQPADTSTPPAPEYAGTWKGTNIDIGGGTLVDITATMTETTYQFDLFAAGTTAQVDGSRGTHGVLTANTECAISQTEAYVVPTGWGSSSATRTILYTLSGSNMSFNYEYTNPRFDTWDISGTLVKQ